MSSFSFLSEFSVWWAWLRDCVWCWLWNSFNKVIQISLCWTFIFHLPARGPKSFKWATSWWLTAEHWPLTASGLLYCLNFDHLLVDGRDILRMGRCSFLKSAGTSTVPNNYYFFFCFALSCRVPEDEYPFLRDVLQHELRIVIEDGRTLTGRFICTDCHSNIILMDCAQLVPGYSKYAACASQWIQTWTEQTTSVDLLMCICNADDSYEMFLRNRVQVRGTFWNMFRILSLSHHKHTSSAIVPWSLDTTPMGAGP